MPVYTRDEFDELPDSEKRKSFTITAMKNTSESLRRVEALRDLIAETIEELDEDKAWKSYFRQAKKYLKREEIGAVKDDLFVSFRYARQTAYNVALNDVIESNADVLYGIQLFTQDDARVRPQHAKWHGVTRPADDPIWDKIKLPWDHGCRCFKLPITWAEYEANPNKYKVTPPDEIPGIPRGF